MSGPEWLRRTKDGIMEVISIDGTTAQIDPLRFCKWLKASVEKRGVKVINPASATEVLNDARGILSGIRIVRSLDGKSQDCECFSWNMFWVTTRQADRSSTVHTPSHHVRCLVAPRLLDLVPQGANSYSCFLACRPFATCAEPVLQSTQSGKRGMPRRVRDRHVRLLARVVCEGRRGAVLGRTK